MNKIEDIEQQTSLLQKNISYQGIGTIRKYLFFWIYKLFKDGATNQMTQKAIPKVPHIYSSNNSFKKFSLVFQQTNDLKISLWRSMKFHIIQSCIIYWLICTFQMFLPLILSKAQEFFISDQENQIRNIFIFAIGQLIYYLTLSILQPIYLFTQSLVSLQIQGALQIEIMNQTLKFPLQRSQKYTPGDLINLLQVDVLQSSNYFINKFQCYAIIYQLMGAFLIFYYTVRENSFIPAIGVILQASLGILFGLYFGKIQNNFMQAKDERMSGVDESLSQIKQIKFNVYEEYFEKRIKNLRGEELKYLKQQVLLLIFIQFMQNILSFSTWECTFYFSTYITFPITTVIMQNSSQLMYLLQNFPNQLKNYYASKNSIHRVKEFFKTQKIVPWPREIAETNYALKINGSFNWDTLEVIDNQQQNQQTFNLKLDVIKGKFIAIIGNSASGKSTILKSILNETNCLDGQIIVNGQISLATQEPWIINDTIKNNITYLDRFELQKYQKVISACALEEDINQFINKDQTQLSEKGDNLSGGQQKRINLARAVYKNADIYIFDDPLSALDVKVKCHVLSECFLKLLQGKTRILFTNSTFNLQNADEIYLIQDNQLTKLEKQIQNLEEQKQFNIDEQFEKTHFEDQFKLSKASFIVNSEDQQVGRIQNQVIKAIFQFQGGFWSIFVIILYFAILMVLSTLSSKILSNPNLTAEEFRTTALLNFPLFNIPIYVAIISITGYFLLIGIKTSSIIHDNIFSNLLKASFTQFYNQILLGRLMNRLSKDIYNIDMLFPNQIYNLSIQFTNLIMPLITSLIFLNYIAYPIILIFIIILSFYTVYYYKCLTELTRIESVSKSPVFANYQQILRGLLYVRTCLPNQLVQANHCDNVNLDLGNQFYLVGLQQWFSQTSGIITNIFQAILFIVCLLFPNDNPAMIFLVVIQMSNVSTLLVQVAVSCGNLLMYSISFERCLHLANNIEIEDYQNGNIFQEKNGQINFKNASFQYPNNQKDVLVNLNLKIDYRLKIGIVGRTGAGKSSIIMALTKMIELSDGNLEINGIDYKKYNLKALRNQFSIIPQEALVFKGTLLENLDPFTLYDQNLILEICEQCNIFQMKSFKLSRLQTRIQQNGQNLSQGEKQLISIVRCLLEDRKIVLVDEATANIDIPTENLIKNIFKQKFQDKIIIAIAHKVSTIMDSDLILVLNSGQIAELDSPSKLLSKPQSEFRKIVDLINQNL